MSAITTSASSAILWGVTLMAPVTAGTIADARTGAGTTSIIAVMFWLVRGSRRRAADDRARVADQGRKRSDEVYARIIGELAERSAREARRHLRPVADSGPLPRA